MRARPVNTLFRSKNYRAISPLTAHSIEFASWNRDCSRNFQERRMQIMPLVYIVLVLIVAGVVMWLINTYIPMAGGIKAILNAVVVVVVIVWVLQAVGLWGTVLNYRVPR
jgi:hypothetical protein